MRIGFDVTALGAPYSGVGTYTSNLFDHLRRFPHDEIVPVAQAWAGVPDTSFRLNKTVWMQTVLPLQLSRAGIDVCHFTNNVASWWTPCPSIVTIHDMTLWLFPNYHPHRRLLAMRPFLPIGARHAKAIITVSNSAKRDVVRMLNVAEEKVHVVYEAPAPHFRPVPDRLQLEAVRKRYALPETFVLSVGTIEPRKNLDRLIDAVQQLRPCVLVVVGNRGWRASGVLRRIERLGLDGAVRLLGSVPAADLVCLYNLATVVAFPSFYEGFGLPVVEAMACGTPVVTSPKGSLVEIAGTAAELVDPTDVESIAAGLRRVLADPDRQAELRAAGLTRAAQFSWPEAAAQTRAVYTRVLGAGASFG